MIMHKMDEAVYLANKIVLVNNGQDAKTAEVAQNSLPTTDIGEMPKDYYPRNPPPVNPETFYR